MRNRGDAHDRDASVRARGREGIGGDGGSTCARMSKRAAEPPPPEPALARAVTVRASECRGRGGGRGGTAVRRAAAAAATALSRWRSVSPFPLRSPARPACARSRAAAGRTEVPREDGDGAPDDRRGGRGGRGPRSPPAGLAEVFRRCILPVLAVTPTVTLNLTLTINVIHQWLPSPSFYQCPPGRRVTHVGRGANIRPSVPPLAAAAS
ncbi:uncharacterized protein LOC144945729 isoform X1 [Lampetra fluviatilis]